MSFMLSDTPSTPRFVEPPSSLARCAHTKATLASHHNVADPCSLKSASRIRGSGLWRSAFLACFKRCDYARRAGSSAAPESTISRTRACLLMSETASCTYSAYSLRQFGRCRGERAIEDADALRLVFANVVSCSFYGLALVDFPVVAFTDRLCSGLFCL